MLRLTYIGIVLCAVNLCEAALLAHGTDNPQSFQQLYRDWELDPGTVISVAVISLLYWLGLKRLKMQMPSGAIRNWQKLSFWTGIFSLCVALLSPLHPLGRVLFSAHMTQHEILMLVAAPFIVLGRPMVVCLKAFPSEYNRRIFRWTRTQQWTGAWNAFTHPFTTWLIHGVVLWAWHVPVLFQATISNDFIHALQHLSFFGSALLFWWAVLHGRQKRVGYGLAVLYMFTTALHSGVLGALLTFTKTLWYPDYNGTTSAWGLTPIEDQQLGGLIMWVPASLVYIAAGLALFTNWLDESEKRSFKINHHMSVQSGHLLALPLCLSLLLCIGCDQSKTEQNARVMTHGNPVIGKTTIDQVGCSSCHTIPGIRDAHALVGPPLVHFSKRTYIGGVLENTPSNLVAWLLDPPAHAPRTAMPDLHLTEQQARDIAAYLYTLK